MRLSLIFTSCLCSNNQRLPNLSCKISLPNFWRPKTSTFWVVAGSWGRALADYLSSGLWQPIGHQWCFSKWIPPLCQLASRASTSNHIHQIHPSTIINYMCIHMHIYIDRYNIYISYGYHMDSIVPMTWFGSKPNDTPKRRSWALDPYQPGHCS